MNKPTNALLSIGEKAEWLREHGTVAVLMGGNTAEREISLKSGKAVAQCLKANDFNVVEIDSSENLVTDLLAVSVDFVFIALHGGVGENGCVQALLELMGLCYSGSGVGASALAMDKVKAKQLWSGLGLPTPKFVELAADDELTAVLDKLNGCVFVKPVSEGSSFGMSIARNESELLEAYNLATPFGDRILVEQYIDGPEYTVAILGERELPSIRVQTKRDFYDYCAKYQDDDTQFHVPSGLSDAEEMNLQKLARKAFDALGCCGWGRVDFIRDSKSDQFYLLEVNTVPGLTSHSLVPMAANAVGQSFYALILDIINAGMEINS